MEMKFERGIVAVSDKSVFPAMENLLVRAGVTHIDRALTGPEILERLAASPADILLADAVLPGMDAFRLAQEILSRPLRRRPSMVFMALPGYLPDFSGLNPLGAAWTDKPVCFERLKSLLESLHPEKRILPAEKAAMLHATLSMLGIPEHPGRMYLYQAVALVWMDERYFNSRKDLLYPAIGRKYGRNAAHVERSMRYAIDYAWRAGDIEQQHRIFGDTIDARRGKPTCGEMIARLAGILRWEGQR